MKHRYSAVRYISLPEIWFPRRSKYNARAASERRVFHHRHHETTFCNDDYTHVARKPYSLQDHVQHYAYISTRRIQHTQFDDFVRSTSNFPITQHLTHTFRVRLREASMCFLRLKAFLVLHHNWLPHVAATIRLMLVRVTPNGFGLDTSVCMYTSLNGYNWSRASCRGDF